MKSFSKLYSDFWINYDNSEVLSTGIDGQLMALYLQSNTHNNMLGVYYLPLLYMASDLKLPLRKVQITLEKLCNINYCKYDKRTQYVWVCNLALNQVGEEIGSKDNRIKALQAIWKSLPTRLEFLEDIYNKYHSVFYFKPPKSCKVKDVETLESTNLHIEAKETNNVSNVNKVSSQPIDASANIINRNTSIHTDINVNGNVNGIGIGTQSPVGCITQANLSVPSSKGASEFVEDLSEEQKEQRTNIVNQVNISKAPLKRSQSFLESSLAKSNVTELVKTSKEDTEGADHIAMIVPTEGKVELLRDSLQDLQPSKFSKDTLDDLISPFEGPSNPLRSPSEAPLEPLRSNIEDRSKNIEDRNKKKEIEEELEKENIKKEINNNQVPTLNIVAQARQCVNELPNKIDKNSFVCKKPNDTSKEPLTQNNNNNNKNNLPVICSNSNSKPKTKAKAINPTHEVDDRIVTIFNHWKKIMNHPRSNLDNSRRDLISRALKWGYSVEQLCEAITGCFLTPFYTGDNPRGQHYTGLHIIFRDADQIDKFIQNCRSPPRPKTEADHRLQSNLSVANEWVNKKSNELADTTRNNYA